MHSDLDLAQHQTAERLRRLSGQSFPPYDWLEFRRRAQIRVLARQRQAVNGLPYVAAAAALLVVVVGGMIAVLTHRGSPHVIAHAAPQPVESLRGEGGPDAGTRVAERWLAALPPEPIIVRFGTRVAVTRLENQIAQVDDLLTAANFADAQPAHVAALQQERGRLVHSLAQVRYAEALAANAP
jgi:hypothetical protein